MDKKKRLKFCELCRKSVQNEIKYGKFMQKGKISVHYYCLLLSSNLVQNGGENEGFLGFLPNDIIHEANRVKTQYCYYCRTNYANVACCASKCRKTFHLTCGVENGVISHFTGTYQSFCPRHVKKCNKTERPSEDEICLVCYEKLGRFNKYFMFQSPCCKTGWFHKWCLAKFALSAGYFFKCPKCNNSDNFREQVMRRGIFIPDQDASWELETNAFAELLERPSECIANECVCPNGRSFDDEGQYNLLICHTCGSKAIHSKCMKENLKTFTCEDCTEIIKNCSIDIGGQTSRNTDEREEQISENESENVNICNNSDDNESTISQELEEKLESGESDDDIIKFKFMCIKKKHNPLRIDSDDEEVDESLFNISNDSLISKSHKLCNKNDEIDNNNKNLDDNKEQIMIKEDDEISNDNLEMVDYRSASVSSCESINRALALRKKKKKSSSFYLPLKSRVFRTISCESLYRSDSEECEITKISTTKLNNSTKDNNMMYESVHQTKIENCSTPNNNYDEEIRTAAAQIGRKRCSSLGYISDNFPSSSENLKLSAAATCYKYDNNYGKENKNMKRRRSNIDEYNYDENNSVSQRITAAENIKDKLRKRVVRSNVPYQLRERSKSISYVITDDYPELSNLNEKWSLIFSTSQHNRQPRRKKLRKFKESISKNGNLTVRQTSMDSFIKRCQTASTSF